VTIERSWAFNPWETFLGVWEMRKFIVSTLLAGAAFAAQPAQAALVASGVSCSAADIGLVAPVGFQCVGFYNGNLANNATSGDQTAALALLGLTFPNAFSNAIQKLSKDTDPSKIGASGINFDQMLYGMTYIGLHAGNVPNPAGGQVNNVSAFYLFDAGVNGLNIITLGANLSAISNATLYKTGTPPPQQAVPEPATWAMMIGGLGLVGASMRRRATKVQFA
jgi:hypothetical protein